MSALLAELRRRGWVVGERADPVALLPEDVAARYPIVPTAITRFLGSLEVCHNAAEDIWMLTPAEVRTADEAAFRWNEYEIMALEADEGDPESHARIRAFWDQHLPIMMAVHSDYDYLAVRVVEPDAGSIVHGFAPYWEEPTAIARSWEEFLTRFATEAASDEPEFPYSVFL